MVSLDVQVQHVQLGILSSPAAGWMDGGNDLVQPLRGD
jgi:hypothetical protein